MPPVLGAARHVAEEPSQVIFDPGRVLLCALKVDKPESLWMNELAQATLAIDRAHAATALAKRGGPAASLLTACRCSSRRPSGSSNGGRAARFRRAS